MPAPRFVLDEFWPSDLFLGGIPGAWYDPTDVNVNWRRNLLTYTEQFDNAAWTKNQTTVTANSSVAPDGTTTADTVIPTVAGGAHNIYTAYTYAAGVHTLSMYAKANGYNWIKVASAFTGQGVFFDVLNGTVGTANAGYTGTIQAVGAGWFRCAVTWTAAAGSDLPGAYIATANGVLSFNGDGTSGVLLWGAQLEVASSASAYQQIVTPESTYAATQTTNLFQDAAGTTPVWAVEQPVGLILDKSQGVAVGATIVTNGDFSAGTTGWSAGNNATLTSPASDLRILGDGVTAYPSASQSLTSVAGRWYRATVTLKAANMSAFFILRNGPYGAPSGQATVNMGTTPGTYTVWLYATGALMSVGVEPVSGAATFDATIDNVSVVPVAGNHASQSTAASRPTYRARYNLLTYSEQFDNAYWAKAGGTISTNTTLAPDGTTTADTWTATAGTSRHEMLSNAGAGPATVANANHTFTLYVKKGTHNFVSLLVTANNTTWYVATFDFSGAAPVVSKTGAGAGGVLVSTSIEAAANGFWRLGVTGRTTDAVSVAVPVLASSATPTYGIFGEENWLAAGTETAIFWGAQLLTAADVTATGNAYQRIAAATVYDTAPIFRPYLAFDGLDDSLSTAAINFTATDKMTVCLGVNKQSDATGTTAIIAETSANVTANAGSFAIGITNGPNYFSALAGTAWALYTETTFTSPTTNVVTTSFDIAGAAIANEIFPRVNAAIPTLAATGANAGTGNFGTWPLYVGRRASTSLPFNGRLYSLIVRGAASSVTEIADTELWVNQRTGAF